MWCFANNKAVQLLKFGKGKKVTWIKTSLYNRNHHDDASTSSTPDSQTPDAETDPIHHHYTSCTVYIYTVHTLFVMLHLLHTSSQNQCMIVVLVGKRRKDDNNKQNVTLVMVLNEIFRTYLKKILYPSVRHPVLLKCWMSQWLSVWNSRVLY